MPIQRLAIDDPAVAEFVASCGILKDEVIPQFRADHGLGSAKHKVAIQLKCVDLDDLIKQQIELERLLQGAVSFGEIRQSGHGWVVRGSIGG